METFNLTAVVECNRKGEFSIFSKENICDCAIGGYGRTLEEAQEDFKKCLNEMKELSHANINSWPEKVEVHYIYEASAIFTILDTINVSRFAKFAGINASKLRAYSRGVCKPSKPTKAKIEVALHNLSRTLAAISLS
ncbi:MAG: hypothetical protein HUJ95_02465 [Bacteroidales bacterium]|nr:hypothetical protein [Bacteroidales bacterium]